VKPTSHLPNFEISSPSLGFGLCEGILFSLTMALWVYSFYRLYSAWQKVLNFSESSLQGPMGWDFLVNWILERIQVSSLISA